MLSIHFYFEINDRNVKSGRFMKCGLVFVVLCQMIYNLQYVRLREIFNRLVNFQILIINGLARGVYTYKQANKPTNKPTEPLISELGTIPWYSKSNHKKYIMNASITI